MRIEVIGGKLLGRDVRAVLDAAARVAEEARGAAQVMDARYICGKEHLEVAAEKALRAREQGRMSARTLAGEILLYASGERQIKEAIRKMGVREDTTAVGVVVVGEVDIEEVIAAIGLTRDDSVLEASPAKLVAYGISKEELASVDPDRAVDLVLEKVALVDLLK